MTAHYFATCPKGLEDLLEEELQSLSCEQISKTVAGVRFAGDLSTAYRVNLWSRLASKILMPLAEFRVDKADDLYQGCEAIGWENHLAPTGSLAVDFIGSNDSIRHSKFGALRVKDAIVDRFRRRKGERPSVEKRSPDLRVNVRLHKGTATVCLDMSGESLHRRGYRIGQGDAPLKENLAAALLLRMGWTGAMGCTDTIGCTDTGAPDGILLDPMCGSGTILFEGAMIAADIAPGILRAGFGFETWLGHREDLWSELREEALERKNLGLQKPQGEIRGYDCDLRVIRAAEANAEQGGFAHWIKFIRKDLADFSRPTHKAYRSGLLLTNPPYGERLGDQQELQALYAQLGEVLKRDFEGWRAGVFTADGELGKCLGVRARKRYKLFNGAIPAQLLVLNTQPESYYQSRAQQASGETAPDPWAKARAPVERPVSEEDLSPGALMLFNRLKKNLKPLKKWAEAQGLECYRLYNADLPEYSAAIDLYGHRVHVQEYRAPKSVDSQKAAQRLQEIILALRALLEVGVADISVKQRERQSGSKQYGAQIRQGHKGLETEASFVVRERQAKFEVNIHRYLDTGLFLDHRPIRQYLFEHSLGKKFLNLFCYTATITVQAALGGARSSVSVDLSNTYLEWAKRNFALNNISEKKHQLIRSDCFQWLKDCREGFDVIMLDPPSFSNSKRMDRVLDVQKDHVPLIVRCMDLLNPGGMLIFSNNLRSFKLDEDALAKYQVSDITDSTLDRDFRGHKKVHHCWLIKNTG